MRVPSWIVGALLFVWGQVASVGCGSESTVTCDEGGCECRDRNSCSLDCGDVIGCRPTCTATGNTCNVECTEADCEFRCLSAESCAGVCGENCYVSCGTAQTCQAETGANSEYQCVNVSDCAVVLGDNSTARCLGANSCSARCVGTCTVFCLDASSCNVVCEQGDRTTCGQATYTCGMDCP
jgi:hypothetical protein